jgi:hypothetical protein
MRQKGFWFIGLLGISMVGHAVIKPENFCLKRCFYQCKEKSQAVKSCQVSNVSMVGFNLKCECRSLKKGESLPENPPAYLIKNRVA